jgi:GDP-mannose 6-dehydrogenase
LQQIPHIGRLLQAEMENVLDWADHLIVAQKPNEEMARQIVASGLPVLDLLGTGMFEGAPVPVSVG